jgi:hypothetical protein
MSNCSAFINEKQQRSTARHHIQAMNPIQQPLAVAVLKPDCLYAALCLMGAVYFIFRNACQAFRLSPIGRIYAMSILCLRT